MKTTLYPAGTMGRSTRDLLVLHLLALAAWSLVYVSLAPAAAWFARAVFGSSVGTPVGKAIEFFVYDAPKVLLLLVLIVYIVGVIRTFFTPERTRRLLAGRRESAAHVLAVVLGVVTPFCSCSSVPLFIGFVTAGVPLGVTFTFLVASPLVSEVAFVLLIALFGWKVALLYLMTGVVIAILAGWIIGRIGVEGMIEPWAMAVASKDRESDGALVPSPLLCWADRSREGVRAVRETLGKVWVYVLLGIAVGAWIHGYAPTDLLVSSMGRDVWWGVPLAVLIGVPMYANAAGIIPIVEALLAKGAALGTALAFMMAVIALSVPEMIILRTVLRPRLLALFVGIVALGITLVGYLFNALL